MLGSDSKFNQEIKPGVIPQSVKYLIVPSNINKELWSVNLHNNLKLLVIER